MFSCPARTGLRIGLFVTLYFLICSQQAAAIECYECHGSKAPADYRPVDAPDRNPQTGGFPGSHRKHMDETATPASCASCHPGSQSYGPDHRNGQISVGFSAPAAVYRNGSTSFPQRAEQRLGSCNSISCHGDTSASWGAAGACLDCHSRRQGNRAAITGQFGANSHHVQGEITNAHCYQCHWEANSDGSINTTFHQGAKNPGSPAHLVIYGAGARPINYVAGETGISYIANGSRSEIGKITTHCIGCHSDQNNTTQPFNDGKSPKQYAWDGTSVAARYNQTGSTVWGKYSSINGANKKVVKAYSAHANAAANSRGWDSASGVDGAIPNSSGATSVHCFDCHNSHGSGVSGFTTRYASATLNGGILKDTAAGECGYAVSYQPGSGGAPETKNSRNPGASLCLDCHLNQTSSSTPWGYGDTFGATGAILGYWDSPGYKNFTGSGPGGRFPFKKANPTMGGHFGASSPLSVPPQSQINGLCTPCHDPHGVSPTLGSRQQYAVPLLKGTWLTSPYREDTAPKNNTHFTNRKDLGYEGAPYHIDQNTFGSDIIDPVAGIAETGGTTAQDSDMAGLCLGCHPKESLTDGVTHDWKSKNRIHESVKGWKTANGTIKHNYSCSKCHAPHNNTNLPRLMVTNCLDKKHKGRSINNIAPITSDSGHKSYWTQCSGAAAEFGDWGWCLSLAGSGAFAGSGAGGMPGSWSGSKPGFQGHYVGCHENNSPDQSWNQVTPWEASPSAVPAAPTLGVPQALSTSSIRWNYSDPADDKDGFRVHDDNDAIKTSSANAGSSFADETGLVANTRYTRHLHAYNAAGESLPSSTASIYTLAKEPSVTADKPNGAWYTIADYTFTNAAGFGPGGVEYYRYAWTQQWPYTFTGTEPVWDNGTLTRTATADGPWYLFLKAYNAEDQPAVSSYGATMWFSGPFYYDVTPPSLDGFTPEAGSSVALNNPLVLTISDPHRGIDPATLTVRLNGNMGYAKTFTTAQSTVITTIGSAAAYKFVVKPDAPYGNGEQITWDITVKDILGNTLNSTPRSFTADSSLPPIPIIGDPVAIAPDSIAWAILDSGSNSTSVRLHDSDNNVKGTAGPYSYYVYEYGLSPNSPYTRHIHAYNASGESAPSMSASRYTMPPAANVTADVATSSWFKTPITFTNTAGFGAGKVAYYRYSWDQNPNGYNSDTNPIWDSGTLVKTPSADGNWYLHVVSYNAVGAVYSYSPTTYGPFRYDTTAPSGLANASPANGMAAAGANTQLSVVPASDGFSGSVQYLFELAQDNSFSQGMISSGWQNGTSFSPILNGATTYFWRVKARDAVLNETPFTPAWNFTTAAFQTTGVTWSSKGDFENNLTTTNTPTVARQLLISGTAQADDASISLAMDRVVRMAGGALHSLALTSDGAVWGWGSNSFGELGVTASGTELAPVQSASLGAGSGVVAISAGYEYSLALKQDGALLSFGLNNSGQLGYTGGYSNPVPTQVTGFGAGSGTVAASAGYNYALALKSDGSVWAWGDNYSGQLGTGNIIGSFVPKAVSGLAAGSGVIAISAGSNHALALKADGTVLAWGGNAMGQLGDGTTTSRLAPIMVPGLTDVVAIVASSARSYVIKSDGSVWGWGYNQNGELGDGSANPYVPTPVQLATLSDITALASGNNHTLALQSDGTVWGWGKNEFGQLGDATTEKRIVPVQLPVLSGTITVATGFSHTLALKGDGSLHGCGRNTNGQVGDGTIGEYRTPVAVNISGIMQPTTGQTLFCGGTKTLAMKSDGTIWGWGHNYYGALGDGTMNDHNIPVQATLFGNDVTGMAVSYDHSLLLKADGTVWGVGSNDNYQLGDGIFSNFKLTPVKAVNLTDIRDVAAGYAFSLALKSDGTVYGWGANSVGQTGWGSTSYNVSSPTQVSGMSAGSGVIKLAAGNAHALALKSNGTVWGWGSGSSGQIGNGVATTALTPAQAAGLTNVMAIAAGENHSLALKTDGTVWAWGKNSYGQLGDGSTTQRNSPVQVAGLTGVVGISAGTDHSIALLSDGTVKAWGRNNYGQLGDGSNIQRITPVTVAGLSGVVTALAGNNHNVALLADGTLRAWGNNASGEIGQGSTGGPNLPVPIVSMANLKRVSGGNLSSLKLGSPDMVDWGTVEWHGSTPAATAITFRTRGADSEAALSGASWSDFYPVSGARITTSASKWLELELTLQSSDNMVTPMLDDVTVTYMH